MIKFRNKIANKIALIGFLFTFLSCSDTIESKQIKGPYFISAIDGAEFMRIIYSEHKNGSGGVLVDNTVFDVQWNDKFILAKQHPVRIKPRVIEVYGQQIFDSLKQIREGRNIHLLADSLAKLKYETQEQKGIFEKFKGKNQAEITLFYIIDMEGKNRTPQLFLSEKEFNLAVLNLKVGKLTNRKYYSYLDK